VLAVNPGSIGMPACTGDGAVPNWPSNCVLTSYDTLVGHCCGAWNKLVGQPWTIMSIGLHD